MQERERGMRTELPLPGIPEGQDQMLDVWREELEHGLNDGSRSLRQELALADMYKHRT